MNGFLTVSQAAGDIGVTRQAIQKMIESQRLQAVWMLERWAVPESEVVRVKGERKQKRKKARKPS